MIFIKIMRDNESDNYTQSLNITCDNETKCISIPLDTIDYQCFSLN